MSDEDIPARLWLRMHQAQMGEALEPFTEAEMEWAAAVVRHMVGEDDVKGVMES